MTVSRSAKDIRSRAIRAIRARPTRYRVWINSPTARTRRFAKWSISSAWSCVLFRRMTSRIVETKSSFVKIGLAFSCEKPMRWLNLYRPTSDKSYRSKLKNIAEIKLRALSTVAKSPGRTRLYTSRKPSSEFELASFSNVAWINFTSGSVSISLNCSRISSFEDKPNTRISAVTGMRRLRSIFTPITPAASVSNSNQAPRLGIIFAPYKFFPR